MTPAEALRETLQAEHAAVYALAVIGGRLSASANPSEAARVRAAYDVHRGRRDHLRAALAAAGEDPVAAAPAYEVPADTRSATLLLRAARETETRCTEVYAQLVAATSGERRAWAVEAMVDSAARVLELGGRVVVWPGLPELS